MKTRRLWTCRFGPSGLMPNETIKKNILKESRHIFQQENPLYDKKIKNAYNECILKLKNNKNLTSIYKNNNIEYVETIIENILPDYIDNVKLYIGINYDFTNEEEISGINISFPLDINQEGFNSNILPVFKSNQDKIELCTIVITLPNIPEKYLYNNEKYIGIIKHEMIHIFHEVIKEQLSINAGNAFYYANTLAELNNFVNIPNYEVLYQKYLNNINQLSYRQLLYVFIGCIYYLDESEQQAWQSSFDTYYRYNDEKYIDDLCTIRPYAIFYSLYQILIKYKKEFVNILNYCNSETKNLIIEWLESKNLKYTCNFNKMIKRWIINCKKYLDKCEIIYNDYIKK